MAAPQERRFKKNLISQGSAAKVRDTVSQAVRESTNLTKAKLIEPLNYENELVKNKTLLHNDPQREMLLFPPDDVKTSHIPRKFRTVGSSVSEAAKREASSLLVKECIKSYTASWSRVHYTYYHYSGGLAHLPKNASVNELPQQVFEVDEEHDKQDDDISLRLKTQQITKQGWLYKGPDNGNESNFSAFTRSFKRRYFYLKQQADTTYVMEYHKDDKKLEAKGCIFLDSAVSVVKNTKRGKPCIELHMQDASYYMFAADTDHDLDSWITALKKVIASNEAMNEKLKVLEGTPVKSENFQQSLEHSMNPELQKYARETDSLLAQQRKDGRNKLFSIFPDVQKALSSTPADISGDSTKEQELYTEVFGTRFVVHFDNFQLRLQANLNEQGPEILANPEPFFLTFALYDAKHGCKISEDFHYDPNIPQIRDMLTDHVKSVLNGGTSVNGSVNGGSSTQQQTDTIHGIKSDILKFPDTAIFSVTNPHPEIYLVARIEKVLNGAISAATEPYMKSPDPKSAAKIHKQMKLYCTRLGQYRMPFAWAARPIFKYSKSSTLQSNQSNGGIYDSERPVFKPFSVDLDTYSDFAIYKAEGARYSEEDLIKNIQDFKKPEKQGKWQTVYASLKIRLSVFTDKAHVDNVVTSSLQPVRPFPTPEVGVTPAYEVAEFVPSEGKFAHPYSVHVNHLYIYPKNLKYDVQKIFAKARNIACHIEVRERDDGESSPALPCIYSNGGDEDVMTTQARCAVIHHSSSPDFQQEVKILLPTHIHSRHHIVFTFYHVSCEIKVERGSKVLAKKAHQGETVVGYAWFPLLDDKGRVNVGISGEDKKAGEHQLKAATNLPLGYLNHESFGLNKGSSGPDVRWVDSGKPLFKFNVRLVSTIYTKDQHLHNFFAHADESQQKSSSGNHTPTNGQITTPQASLDFEASNRLKYHGKLLGGVTITPPGSKGSPHEQLMLILVKSLHATDSSTLINFLPTLLNQLFRLLVQTSNDDVTTNATRVLIHIVNCVHRENKPEILRTYVKYVFVTEPAASTKHKTVHEQLALNLKSVLRPTQTDQLVIGKFMNHSWFFFDILIKSMAQHLLTTGRIKMSRHERFSSDYQFHVQTLTQTLCTHISQKNRELPGESRNANNSLANFIKRCFTFMDRGFVFKLVNSCIEIFCSNDTPQLQNCKFDFLRIICEHEHYIPLNLPLMKKTVKNYKDVKHDYTLSEEFCRNHFLVGMLLQEVKQGLNEIREVRKVAIATLRNLLAKHSADDRYQGKSQQARITSLYLPFLMVILENKNRLTPKETLPQAAAAASAAPSQPSYSDTGEVSAGGGDRQPGSRPLSSIDSFGDSSSASGSQHRSTASLPRYQKDPSVFALIAGQVSSLNSLGDIASSPSSRLSRQGSSASINSTGSATSTNTMTGRGDNDSARGSDRSSNSHHRAPSTAGQSTCTAPYGMVRYDKLDLQEIKDLLACFLYIINNVAEEVLLGWFNNSSELDVMDFFDVLEICLQQFKYLGRKRITSLYIIGGKSGGAGLSGSKKGSAPHTPTGSHSRNSGVKAVNELTNMLSGQGLDMIDGQNRAQMEANLSSEVAMIVLDVVSLYTLNFKDSLQKQDGDNNLMQCVFDLHLHFLQSSQSQHVQKNAFASLRAFINKFAAVLFRGDASMCGRMCYEILRCCNSKLLSTRSEACALMYLLMRSNFEFCHRKSFTRVHLQMIVAVSQLINDVVGLSNSRFYHSLSVINSYANNDKAMQRTVFPVEVKDLTKRIRTVLMATAQMRDHQNNPEMLIDLQYSLAKSYTSTPELRKTWLESMAKKHVKYENYSEAAHCYIHIAALVAEYLKRRGEFPQGCAVFKNISQNVQREEAGMRDDIGMHDQHYTEDNLTELLEECAFLFERAERYELLGELYRLIIPIYERKRNFQKLAAAYDLLHKAYSKVVDVMQSGKRMLGKYYRVKFYGQMLEEEDQKEYVYKEPKVTGLHDICERLLTTYNKQYGQDKVKLMHDSNKVNIDDLDPNLAYIQISHVTPYFEQSEQDSRLTDFERNSNIRSFMYETPFTRDGKAHGEVQDQWKRRTILTSTHVFPYVKKRILVLSHKEEELSPIHCAVDEMKTKVSELNEVVYQTKPDVKKLQLKLSGSISPQVNAGPMAYAEAFLKPENQDRYKAEKVSELKEHFREFVYICHSAIDLNGQLIQSDQLDYQEVLRHNFREMVTRLSVLFDEQLLPDFELSLLGGGGSQRGSMGTLSSISSAASLNTSSSSSSNV